MIFAHKTVRDFLLKEGHVFTFRTNDHKLGDDWITDRRGGKKICDVEIRLAKDVKTFEDLLPYVKHCGFKSREEWENAIFLFNPQFTLPNAITNLIDNHIYLGRIFSVYTKEGWMKQYGDLRNEKKETVGFVGYGFQWKTFDEDAWHKQWIIVERFGKIREVELTDPEGKKVTMRYVFHVVFHTNDEIYVTET